MASLDYFVGELLLLLLEEAEQLNAAQASAHAVDVWRVLYLHVKFTRFGC